MEMDDGKERVTEMKKQFAVAFQLSSVGRFARDHLVKSENVLEHMGFCGFAAAILANKMETFCPIDYKKLFRAIVFHDIDESLLGDIPRSTKYYTSDVRDAMAYAEKRTVSSLEFWLDTPIMEEWSSAKSGIEGEILRVVDLAAVVYKLWVEIELLGNKSFLRVCHETMEYLRKIDIYSFRFPLSEEIVTMRSIVGDLLTRHGAVDINNLFLKVGE